MIITDSGVHIWRAAGPDRPWQPGRRAHLETPIGYEELSAMMAQAGDEFGGRDERRRWWDYAIVLTATGVFVVLGVRAVVPPLTMDLTWVAVLSVVLALSLVAGGLSLWRRTRFC